MFRRKEMPMMASKKIFRVHSGTREYTVVADAYTTLDMVWASEKCWFMPGSKVTITNESGHSKIFVKEKGE